MPGLGTSLGRGGATTAQEDLANADAILIMGSSMAENHPVGFQWVIEAREKNNAKVIHVDPRFTRTSAMCDYWLPLRAGSDLVFLGALIRYVLENDRWFREYVVRYTNAAVIVLDDFRDTEDLDGLFSPAATWLYPDEGRARPPLRDETLRHPRCVFQVMRRHFARYTPEMVEQTCGIPREKFLEIAGVFTSASGPQKTGAICYAVGWTQHSTGVQTIRAAAILQLLLGNIGRPGGGIMALRARHIQHARLSYSAHNDLTLLLACPRCDSLGAELIGPEAEAALRAGLTYVNLKKKRAIKKKATEAAGYLDRHGGSEAFIRNAARMEKTVRQLAGGEALALEMAVDEQAELRELERQWRQADEIAEIADNLTVDRSVDEELRRLKGGDQPNG